MEGFLQSAISVVVCSLVCEFCMFLLPEGSLRQVCRFTAVILLTIQLLHKPLKLDIQIQMPETEQITQAQQQDYEDVIWDVYSGLMENKNG